MEKKVVVLYKDDIETLKDSDDDDDAANEDEEVEVYEARDEEEQTAAQVLAEANALSARIIKIVNGWYGGGGGDNDGGANSNNGEKVRGLILGEDEGALCLAGGGRGGEREGAGMPPQRGATSTTATGRGYPARS
jgi:hypothetical protein